MEDQAISDGFSNLQNGKKYDDLYRAALCRERADWSVGMNATRLFSTLYGQTLNVGRVMTPTLHGYVIKMDLADLKELLRLMQISGNNLNQYAKKANETGSIYHEDIEELKKVQKEILQEMRKVLEKLTAIM